MTDDGTRRLILLRHGKSDYPGGVTDHDRPLAPRGRREAALAGRLLADLRPPIDAVLCSTAVRARETLAATGIAEPVTFAGEIYQASAGEILHAIAGVDQTVRSLLVVGHAPGMPATALTLAQAHHQDEDPDQRENPDQDKNQGVGPDRGAVGALADLRAHFPTSAFAVLRVPGRWDELTATGGTLVDFVIPRG